MAGHAIHRVACDLIPTTDSPGREFERNAGSIAVETHSVPVRIRVGITRLSSTSSLKAQKDEDNDERYPIAFYRRKFHAGGFPIGGETPA